jgi:tRNA A-37 threonylcarbamoyl transferase component Bud32
MAKWCGNYKVINVPGTEATLLCHVLLPDPDDLFRQGENVDSGRVSNICDRAKVKVGKQFYFIKRYNCRGWKYRVKNMFRISRARRAMQAGQALQACGIRTPQPLVCLEERRFFLLGSSYLVCTFLEDTLSLLELWPDLDDKRRVEILRQVAELFGIMHRRGIVHGDSNWRNILVRNASEKPEFWIVDLDGTRRYRRLTASRAERDIGHFLRDLTRSGAGEEFARLFRSHWERSLMLTGDF